MKARIAFGELGLFFGLAVAVRSVTALLGAAPFTTTISPLACGEDVLPIRPWQRPARPSVFHDLHALPARCVLPDGTRGQRVGRPACLAPGTRGRGVWMGGVFDVTALGRRESRRDSLGRVRRVDGSEKEEEE